MIGVLSAQIMQACINIQNNFPELRGPTSRLISAGHELRMVVDGFKQRHLEDVSNIKNPVSAFAETAFAVWIGSRCTTRQIPVPTSNFLVTAAAAVSVMNGSITS